MAAKIKGRAKKAFSRKFSILRLLAQIESVTSLSALAILRISKRGAYENESAMDA